MSLILSMNWQDFDDSPAQHDVRHKEALEGTNS